MQITSANQIPGYSLIVLPASYSYGRPSDSEYDCRRQYDVLNHSLKEYDVLNCILSSSHEVQGNFSDSSAILTCVGE